MAISPTINPFNYQVGTALKALRKLHGYTMKAVADGIQMSPSAISSHEQNRSAPTMHTIVWYCQFYKMDLATFYHLVQFTTDNQTPTILTSNIKQVAVVSMLGK